MPSTRRKLPLIRQRRETQPPRNGAPTPSTGAGHRSLFERLTMIQTNIKMQESLKSHAEAARAHADEMRLSAMREEQSVIERTRALRQNAEQWDAMADEYERLAATYCPKPDGAAS